MGKTKTAFIGTEEVGKEKKHKQEKVEKVHIAGLKGGQRIKAIEAEPIVTEESAGAEEQEKKVKKAPKVRGKKYLEAKGKVNSANTYSLTEAIALMKETSFSKFDGSAELHLVVKKAGTSVHVSLPHAGGKAKKVEIASDETIKKLASGKIDFDILVSTPEMMPKLVPFARLLGPKGLMPNPKNGTLISDPKKYSANTLTVKTEREAPLIHTVFGRVSQDAKELKENLEEIIRVLGGGKQITKGYIKATMGPAVKIHI
jgi:large subunit ribosomal protein L1